MDAVDKSDHRCPIDVLLDVLGADATFGPPPLERWLATSYKRFLRPLTRRNLVPLRDFVAQVAPEHDARSGFLNYTSLILAVSLISLRTPKGPPPVTPLNLLVPPEIANNSIQYMGQSTKMESAIWDICTFCRAQLAGDTKPV